MTDTNSGSRKPESERTALGQVSSPKALLPSWTVLVMRHLSGTWPQLSRHTTSGVGTPIAVQLMMKVKVWSTRMAGGGEITIMGEPVRLEYSVVQYAPE